MIKTAAAKLRDEEVQALLDSDGTGRIAIPCGSGSEIEAYLHMLLRMKKAGIVTRCSGTAFYRPFVLTQLGQFLKVKFQNSGTQSLDDALSGIQTNTALE